MPDSTPETAPDAPLVTPDAMARILEPRVRSNAKNNPRAAKNAAPKPSRAPEIPTRGEVIEPGETPVAGEIEVPVEDVPGFQAPLEVAAPIVAPSVKAFEGEMAASVAPIAFPSGAQTAPDLNEVRDLLLSLQEEQQKRDRAFDLLHDELSGYKNDFYLERLKPTLRSLLFLLDSIEDFERETESFEANGESPTPEIVRANLVHFRDQLTDILTLSDMTPIEPEGDKFDPKTQRAIEVVRVDSEQNNTIQRQVRGGWRLGGKMLRAADVVVGRS